MNKGKGSPQLENGYTRIANELLEALMQVNFNSYENRFIRCVVRYTYGFHKKASKISLSFIAKATGIALSHISRTKTILLAKKVVTQSGNKEISLNKHYKQWVTRTSNRISIQSVKNRVYERDKVCQDCKAEKNLQIHHLDNNETNWALNNLILVCAICHRRRHAQLPNQVTKQKLPSRVTKVTQLGKKKLPSRVRKVTQSGNYTIKRKLLKKTLKKTLKDTTLKSRRKTYGNKDINFLIKYLKEKLELPILDGSVKQNRRYCWLSLKKFGGKEKMKLLIDTTSKDNFWKTKITSFQQLYYKGVQIISKTREKGGEIIYAGDTT